MSKSDGTTMPPVHPREWYAELGRRSAAARVGGVVLRADEVEAMDAAFRVFEKVARRARRKRVAAEDVTEMTTEEEAGDERG